MSQDASQPSDTPHATGAAAPSTGSAGGGEAPLWGNQGQPAPGARGTGSSHRTRDAWAAGGTVFAGVLLCVNGVLHVLQGISAIVEDTVYTRVNGYVYRINLTGWGWILVVLGAIAIVVGWGILKDADWARLTGILLASLSIIFQFMFLPYAPVWSLVVIAIDCFVIWALAVHKPGPTTG
ncbi:hypothetical protein BKI49_28095 [Streptomyces sp. Tue6028]|uniref:DUF7144 family membrane protein n=1 Tax=Streptomyces sp. Tue6028 TaxID=2036037 RepID=UPI000BB3268B|nr:hypothetical protein [Streptomyces sp. Tue6028]PBC60390.1 hypothetical protein BKI49_28095 [Streptomyces sp. Tue6028]